MGVTEWDALPWWQQRVYTEGLREEFTDSEQSEESPRRASRGPTVFDGDRPGEFKAQGFNERTI